MIRTYIYIDGFNLYYGLLKKNSQYKWLDLKALFSNILKPTNNILKIKYYTARISARPDDLDGPTRQDIYLQAIEKHIPELTITEGHFIQKSKTMKLVTPISGQQFARVMNTEEKGSDVNLAVHMVNDAWKNLYDCAVVCSNDGDLSEALRIVKRDLHKSVVLLIPGNPSDRPPSVELKRWASTVKHIPLSALASSQLPDHIPGTTIHKPHTW